MRKIFSAFLILLSAAFVGSLPNFASAHAIGQIYSLPVPLKYYLLGAALAVAFSFFVLAIFLNKTNDDKADKKISAGWLKGLLAVLKILSLLLFILTIATGIFGSQDPTRNFTPVFFWTYFLIGIAFLSGIVGNIWDKLNPWKIISNWLNYKSPERQAHPGFGALLILILYWFELVSLVSFEPRTISLLIAVYTLVNIIGGFFYENWYRDIELFSVFFGFIGKLAHYRISDDEKNIIIVNENNKLSGTPTTWSALIIACILLAGTSFDAFKETFIWYNWMVSIGHTIVDRIPNTIGLILAPIPFLVLYFLAIWIMQLLVGKEYSFKTLAKQFVWSIIPIAFGYTLAHNFSLMVVSVPRIYGLISDPFGFGWNLFHSAKYIETDLILGAKLIWFIEIGFVVLAHIFGVWYAHVLALNIFKNPKTALKSQIPMVLLMISFTVMTLWLLSKPLVSG